MRGAKHPLRPVLMSTSQQIEMLGAALCYGMHISALPPHSKVNSSFILPCAALVQGSALRSLLYLLTALLWDCLHARRVAGGALRPVQDFTSSSHLLVFIPHCCPPGAACLHTDSLKETSHCHFSFHCSLLCSHSSPPLPLVFLPVPCSFSLM